MNLKSIARHGFMAVQAVLNIDSRTRHVNVVGDLRVEDRALLEQRIAFYFPEVGSRIHYEPRFTLRTLFSQAPLLYWRDDAKRPFACKWRFGTVSSNPNANPRDGWEWADAVTYAYPAEQTPEHARQRLVSALSQLGAGSYERCYAFGTGPSLGRAIERDWHDGFRIVCNTIVRDPELWAHINPHLVVAGDAIYHFGFTEFARAFRADLVKRMHESPHVCFVYPASYDALVRRQFAFCADRLIAIPWGTHTHVHSDLTRDFALPALGNVLNCLLLPLGCTVSKEVALWGFDGRAPKDTLFWSNSNKHSYSELLPSLQAAHPAFFDEHVPKEDPEKYVRSVHGDVLEFNLTQAEDAGWRFRMLHHSFTPTLAKRMDQAISSVVGPISP